MNVVINLNDKARVRLTEAGRNRMKKGSNSWEA